MMLIIKEPITAAQNPFTSNPEIIPEAIFSITALMIKVNNPRLRMLIGSVNIIAMGRKKALSIPRAAAAKKAEKKP